MLIPLAEIDQPARQLRGATDRAGEDALTASPVRRRGAGAARPIG
jgi:hypothetical protein